MPSNRVLSDNSDNSALNVNNYDDCKGKGMKSARHGHDFQFHVILLFLLRIMAANVKTYRFGTEHIDGEDFDDIIFGVRDQLHNKYEMLRLFQLKHKEDGMKKIRKSEIILSRSSPYGLPIYFHSYQKLEIRCRDMTTSFKGCQIQDVLLVTNTDLEDALIGTYFVKRAVPETDFLLFSKSMENVSLYEINLKNKMVKDEFLRIFTKTSEVVWLATIIAEHIKRGTIETKNIKLVRQYYSPLMEFVFTSKDHGHSINFREEFLTGGPLLTHNVQNFQQALLEKLPKQLINNEFKPIFAYEEFFIDNVVTFAAQIRTAVNNGILKAEDDKFVLNLRKISSFFLEKHKGEVRFNPKLFNCNLPGNLNQLRDSLLQDELCNRNILIAKDCKITLHPTNSNETKFPPQIEETNLIEFGKRFRLITRFPDIEEINTMLDREMKEFFKTKDNEMLSLFREEINRWFSERKSEYIDAEAMDRTFNEISRKLQKWKLNQLNSSYFSEVIHSHPDIKFKRYQQLEDFLLNSEKFWLIPDQAVVYQRLRLTRSFYSLFEKDDRKFRNYTRKYGHIFLKFNQIFPEPDGKIISSLNEIDLIVVECENEKEFHQFCGKIETKKIIGVCKSPTSVKSTPFFDLDTSSQEKLLNSDIAFQGNIIPLKSLLLNDESKSLIDSETIVQLLEGKNRTIVVGHAVRKFLANDLYIDRQFYSQSKIDIWERLNDHVRFLITGIKYNDLIFLIENNQINVDRETIVRFKNWNFEPHQKYIVIKDEHVEDVQGDFCLVEYRLGDFINPNQIRELSEIDLINLEDDVVLIRDVAGTGKSTTLTSLGETSINRKPEIWSLMINLRDQTGVLDKMESAENYEEFVVDEIWSPTLPRCLSSFERNLLIYSIRSLRNVSIFFDGFDEISPDYEPTVLNLCQSLRQHRVKLFLTTREVLMVDLKESFQVLSFSLKPFDHNDQKKFLIQVWGNKWKSDQDAIVEQSESLLSHVEQIFSSIDFNFTGVPMQMWMLAEMMIDKSSVENFISSNVTNLLSFYDMFVANQCKFFLSDKIKSEFLAVREYLEMEEEFVIKRHQQIAVYLTLPPTILDEIMKNKSMLEKSLELIKVGKERRGIIKGMVNGKPTFIHQTFVEYFCMRYLHSVLILKFRKNIDQKKTIFREFLSGSRHSLVRSFFNMKLEQITIQQELIEFYSELFSSDPSLLITIASRNIMEEKNDITFFILRLLPPTRLSDNLFDAITSDVYDVAKFILQQGGNPNPKHEKNGSALLLAIATGSSRMVQLLLDHGADVNDPNSLGVTPLFQAIFNQNSEIISILLRNEADISAQNRFGDTALIRVVEKGYNGVVSELLSLNVNVNHQNFRGNTALITAVKRNDILIIKLLLEQPRIDVNIRNVFGNTALMQAVENGNLKIVTTLMEVRGINLEVANFTGKTALIRAFENDRIDIVKYMIEHAANVNGKDSDGDTVLSYAVGKKNLTLVKYLTANGADLKCQNIVTGDTVLFMSIEADCYEIAKFLIDCKCSPLINIRNKFGNTALHLAVEKENVDVIRLLVKNDADVDAKNSIGATPLLCAIGVGNVEIVRFLLKTGRANLKTSSSIRNPILIRAILSSTFDVVKCLVAEFKVDVNVKSKNGEPAIILAAKQRSAEMISLFINCGVQVNSQDVNGDTALAIAARQGDLNIIKLLMENEAEASQKNNSGNTPVDQAIVKGNTEIVQYLYAFSKSHANGGRNQLDHINEDFISSHEML